MLDDTTNVTFLYSWVVGRSFRLCNVSSSDLPGGSFLSVDTVSCSDNFLEYLNCRIKKIETHVHSNNGTTTVSSPVSSLEQVNLPWDITPLDRVSTDYGVSLFTFMMFQKVILNVVDHFRNFENLKQSFSSGSFG